MSCHFVYQKDGGAKFMRPIHFREEYLQLRDSERQRLVLQAVRKGSEEQKHQLVQFNYSCLPNDDGSLKGSKRMTTTVAMDIDHVPPEEMLPLRERILEKKDELGLDMLEVSARGEGYHLVFTRRPELSQEDNLKWASDLLGVEYDKGAKDITRVFFTTTKAEMIYLDDKLFEQQELPSSWEEGVGVEEKKRFHPMIKEVLKSLITPPPAPPLERRGVRRRRRNRWPSLICALRRRGSILTLWISGASATGTLI